MENFMHRILRKVIFVLFFQQDGMIRYKPYNYQEEKSNNYVKMVMMLLVRAIPIHMY